MAVDVIMPQMGESIFEGTITKWLKKPGDRIERDEPLFEISTDKVDAEIPAPSAGILKEIKVPEGKTVPILRRFQLLLRRPHRQRPKRPKPPRRPPLLLRRLLPHRLLHLPQAQPPRRAATARKFEAPPWFGESPKNITWTSAKLRGAAQGDA
jgi:pyruvate/2-oxoglutarate dehydrogenase complex dihydrolipoamide acyltransferase (E2) component